MNSWERRSWKKTFRKIGCTRDRDFESAARLIADEFSSASIQRGLADLFHTFLENPCLETAVPIVKRDSEFLVFFENIENTEWYKKETKDAVECLRTRLPKD